MKNLFYNNSNIKEKGYHKKTPPLPAVFSGCPERKERRKRNGHPKLSFEPKVQRRENVGGSLKTLGSI